MQFLISNKVIAQELKKIDSLKALLQNEADTIKVKLFSKIAYLYEKQYQYDEALSNYLNSLELAENIKNNECIFQALLTISDFYEHIGKFNLALEFGMRAQKLAEEQGNKENLYDILNLIGGIIYFNHGMFDKSLEYGQKILKLAEELNDKEKIINTQMYLADVYREQKQFTKSIEIYSKALKAIREENDTGSIAICLNNIGVIYAAESKYKEANNYYIEALKLAEAQREFRDVANYSQTISQTFFYQNENDSAIVYAKKSLIAAQKSESKISDPNTYYLLAQVYASKNEYKNAYDFFTKYSNLKDSLNSNKIREKVDSLQSGYKSEKQNKEIQLLKKQASLQKTLKNVLIISSLLLIIVAFLVANKYRHKKKSELILSSKNASLEKTLSELKSTQLQLIQSEKMASLGELTAGIAHEIQNPLNFVNNFSEVNTELIEELRIKNEKLKIEDEEVKELLNDIKDNSEKINHHGKRADAIVKGMLQHSRSSNGQKEPTDINALCDEYLRLAYHGIRARDKSFNATLKTDFDERIGKVNILPQDIGRVILNLITNAFYVVGEKKKLNIGKYEPTVTVSTKKINNKTEIKVADNGNGIPQNIIDKIFQPFFTTKPTGQGTGLGLSLSYDIVKAHGGELKAETKENEGSIFTITLPA